MSAGARARAQARVGVGVGVGLAGPRPLEKRCRRRHPAGHRHRRRCDRPGCGRWEWNGVGDSLLWVRARREQSRRGGEHGEVGGWRVAGSGWWVAGGGKREAIGRSGGGAGYCAGGMAEDGDAATMCMRMLYMYASYSDRTWSSTNCSCRRYMRASSVGCLTLPAFSSTCSVLCRTCGAVIAGAASGVGWDGGGGW